MSRPANPAAIGDVVRIEPKAAKTKLPEPLFSKTSIVAHARHRPIGDAQPHACMEAVATASVPSRQRNVPQGGRIAARPRLQATSYPPQRGRPYRRARDSVSRCRDACLPADWRDLFALTKPRVMSLVVFTGLCGLLAAPVPVHPVLGFTAVLCIALGAGAAGALNQWYEADLDAKMKRTANAAASRRADDAARPRSISASASASSRSS